MLVSYPFVRMSPFYLDSSGAGQQPFPVTAALAGSSRCIQLWCRDKTHPDGTGVGMSSALEIYFCF